MEKTDVVKSVQGNGSFEFPKGSGKILYKYEIEMENGDVGEYNSISEDQNNFIPGKVVNYLHDISNAKYPKIKPIYNFSGSPKNNGDYQNKQKAQRGDDVQKMIVKQSCLKAAIDYVGPNSQYANVKEVTKIAQFFVDWVYDVQSEEKKRTFKQQIQNKRETTDLPF